MDWIGDEGAREEEEEVAWCQGNQHMMQELAR